MSQKFLNALAVDLVMTSGQARKHYWMWQDILANLETENRVVLETMRISRAANLSAKTLTTFVCLKSSARISERPDWMLRHLAAVAEIRYRLQISPDRWLLRAHKNPNYNDRFASGAIPDAIAMLPIGNTVIEYDAGSHSKKILAEKIAAYAASPQWINQWWYASTPNRAEVILELLKDSGINPRRWRIGVIDWD
jgi:hypothetical protein